jgi:hypothetical protein
MRRTVIAVVLAGVLLAAVALTALAACAPPPPKSGVEKAFEKHKDELNAIPGVRSITIYSGSGAGGDRIEIEVYKGEKTPQLEATVPDELDGYPVVIVEEEPYKPPPVDIQGTIKTISPADTSAREQGIEGTILVIAELGSGSTHAKATVAITGDTTIWIPQGEGKDFITFADLREGDIVIVDFSGPAAESHPVQATARDIQVLPERQGA